ncbi:MAG: alpha/beta fold hydrolase [Halanaeroarchaeum sp.]
MPHWRRTLAAVGGSAVLAIAGAEWLWKRRRLAALAAGSDLVVTDRGVVEVARSGDGPPVLVLHGAPGGYDQGRFIGEAAFGDVDLIAFSRPGYLRTPLDENRTPAEQADLAAALLDELGVERAIAVGFSAGGPAAVELAVRHPDRVAGLVLASAVTGAFDAREYGVPVHPLVDPILTSTPVLDARSAVFVLLRRVDPGRLVALTHGLLSTLEGEALDEYVAGVLADPAQRRRVVALVDSLVPATARLDGTLNDERWFRELPPLDFAAVECPTLVVHGEYDALLSIEQAAAATARIPDAELVRLDADHLAFVGPDADRGGEAVRSFVERVAAAH